MFTKIEVRTFDRIRNQTCVNFSIIAYVNRTTFFSHTTSMFNRNRNIGLNLSLFDVIPHTFSCINPHYNIIYLLIYDVTWVSFPHGGDLHTRNQRFLGHIIWTPRSYEGVASFLWWGPKSFMSTPWGPANWGTAPNNEMWPHRWSIILHHGIYRSLSVVLMPLKINIPRKSIWKSDRIAFFLS